MATVGSQPNSLTEEIVRLERLLQDLDTNIREITNTKNSAIQRLAALKAQQTGAIPKQGLKFPQPPWLSPNNGNKDNREWSTSSQSSSEDNSTASLLTHSVSGDSTKLGVQPPSPPMAGMAREFALALREVGIGVGDVPEPETYCAESGKSFKKWLIKFERYCVSKYRSKEDWTTILRKFLTGKIKDVFENLVDAIDSYEEVKLNLKYWYSQAKRGETSDRGFKFAEARMLPQETTFEYAIRLQGLARKAFPKKKNDRELINKFMTTVPQSTYEKINYQEIIQGRKNVTWEDVKLIAASETRGLRKMKNSAEYETSEAVKVNFGGQQEPQVKEQHRFGLGSDEKYRLRLGSDERRRLGLEPGEKPIREYRRRYLFCTYCDRPGHTEDRCWRKLNRCEICGNAEHKTRDCRKKPVSKSTPKDYKESGMVFKCSQGTQTLNSEALAQSGYRQSQKRN